MGGDRRSVDLGPTRARRRLVSLTPLIDVVFLLLVFFMLAARLSIESEIALSAGAATGGAEGPPRLVEVSPETVLLNGSPIAVKALGGAVRRLAPSPESIVAVRSSDAVNVQRLVDVLDALAAADLQNIVFVGQ